MAARSKMEITESLVTKMRKWKHHWLEKRNLLKSKATDSNHRKPQKWYVVFIHEKESRFLSSFDHLWSEKFVTKRRKWVLCISARKVMISPFWLYWTWKQLALIYRSFQFCSIIAKLVKKSLSISNRVVVWFGKPANISITWMHDERYQYQV